MALPPIVRVKWKDAYTKDENYDHKSIEMMDPFAETMTVGFLVRRSKDAYFVAQDYSIGGEGTLDSFRGVTVVPRGMVISLRELK